MCFGLVSEKKEREIRQALWTKLFLIFFGRMFERYILMDQSPGLGDLGFNDPLVPLLFFGTGRCLTIRRKRQVLFVVEASSSW